MEFSVHYKKPTVDMNHFPSDSSFAESSEFQKRDKLSLGGLLKEEINQILHTSFKELLIKDVEKYSFVRFSKHKIRLMDSTFGFMFNRQPTEASFLDAEVSKVYSNYKTDTNLIFQYIFELDA